MDLSIDLLPDADVADAFARNRLLATLDASTRALLEPHARVMRLEAGTTVLQAGMLVDRTLFPFESLMVSMMVELRGGRSVEVAAIGREGAIGGIVSCGGAPAFTNAVVQVAGSALTIPMTVLESTKRRSPHLQHLFCRYSDFLLASVMQSVACNAFHPIEARAARWLLHAADRVGSDRLALTQEALAALLGVQRTTVNAVARLLQDQGLISYRRGAILLLNRAGLSKVACECYESVEQHFTNVLGPDGRGAVGDCD
jgi:CRP-like cAMP-binding protein